MIENGPRSQDPRPESDCQFSTTRSQISCEKADSRRSSYLPQRVSQVRPMRTELQRKLKEKHKFQHKYNKNAVQEGKYLARFPVTERIQWTKRETACWILIVSPQASSQCGLWEKHARFPFTVHISGETTVSCLCGVCLTVCV